MLNQKRACMCSHSNCVQLFVTPWTVAHQAPLSMEFSWQEYWSRLSCPPPGDLSDPGSKLTIPAFQADSLPLSYWGSPSLEDRFVNKPTRTQKSMRKITLRRLVGRSLSLFSDRGSYCTGKKQNFGQLGYFVLISLLNFFPGYDSIHLSHNQPISTCVKFFIF